jgi:predicted RND superfamily exporter protein
VGTFFRKSFNLGPARVNVSKSGVGGSIGPKGIRVGVNAKGSTYVRGGAGGVYFNNHLNSTPVTARDSVAKIYNALSAENSHRSQLLVVVSQSADNANQAFATGSELKQRLEKSAPNSSNRVQLRNAISRFNELEGAYNRHVRQVNDSNEDMDAMIRNLAKELGDKKRAKLVTSQRVFTLLEAVGSHNEYLESFIRLADGFSQELKTLW